MKTNQAILWRIISGLTIAVISLSFYWLAIVKPDYAAALIFVSVLIQVLTYMAYKNRFP